MNEPELARRTLDAVRAADAVDRVSFGSFGWRVLRAARQLEPRIPTSAAREEVRWALYRSWVRWPLGEPAYREFQVPERWARPGSSPRDSSRTRAAPASPSRSGPSMPRRTCVASLRGASSAIITDRPDIGVRVFAPLLHAP